VPDAADVRAAYRRCEAITRQQAKNFAYGIALLPGPKRRALSAVYALARRIDDIGDGTLPPAEKIAQLGEERAVVGRLAASAGSASVGSASAGSASVGSARVGSDAAGAEGAGDPVLLALGDAAGRFAIPVGAFGELIDGCEADVRGTSYGTFAELEWYCRCVAGSIGRLSLGVFGCRDQAAAAPLADALGVALQLTNILRDIREDLGNGRVYLPADDLARFGCALTPAAVAGQPGSVDGPLPDLIRFEADRALDWYATGMQLLPMLDRRSAACTGAMAGIYLRLLEHISADPGAVLQRRMSLPGREKAAIAAKALAGLGRVGRGAPRVAGRQAPLPAGTAAEDRP
jgi:15-cis-phytoene synthase